MSLKPIAIHRYHVFLASPSDVNIERQYVRRFFDEYNRHTAHLWNSEFLVIDWENYATIGVGRPQELITKLTLEKFKDSMALVVGVMAQRFGSPTGKAESGTEEEFLLAKQNHDATGFPEIKWFFRKIEKVEFPADPDEAEQALKQWKNVCDFRQRMQNLNDPVFFTEYPNLDGFARVFDHDLNLWMNDPERPWAKDMAAASRATVVNSLPAEFESDRYRAAVLKQFGMLNLEMVDSTGAYYNVRLWNVFVPQSARECHKYNPRLLEIPKEHQQRLLNAGQIDPRELAVSPQQAEELRREYFQQSPRPILEIIDQALRNWPSRANHRLVILGDPGSGKSSLIRYLALRWASIADPAMREAQPIPLVIDLESYSRWQGKEQNRSKEQKGFVRFFQEAPVWYDWSFGLLDRLLAQPGRVVLLMDGLDEIFDQQAREDVVNDIQRFSTEYVQIPIVITSRIVGYQSQRLRDAEFRHFMLQDLDTPQISDFIDRWHAQTFDDPVQSTPKCERLKKAILDSKSIAMLAGNPLLLTMMAILNRNQELPRDRVDLYAQASRLLLHQWDTERALAEFPGLSADIGWREKQDLLRRIASFMQAGSNGLKGNMIDGATLAGLIEDYLQTVLHFPQSRAAARAVVDQLRQRNFILCFVGADSYGFVHRTFLEYFCAADFVHQFNIAKTLDEAGLIALFDVHSGEDEWREVLRLLCSQLDEQFVGKIVDWLATRTDLKKRVTNALPSQLPLAIDCLNEAHNLSRLENTGSQLLKSVISFMSSTSRISGTRYIFESNQIVSAAAGLGKKWPGKSYLKQVSFSQIAALSLHASSIWPSFVATVVGDVSLIRSMAVWDGQSFRTVLLRAGALEALAKNWPDESTRTLILTRAVEDQHSHARTEALRLLAKNWPDESTQALLRSRAVEDPDKVARGAALEALADNWTDESTQALLRSRAVEDPDKEARSAALRALADNWTDESTQALLRSRAVEDPDKVARSAALEALADNWTDESTQALLRSRAVEDPDYDTRSAALSALADNWTDESIRALLRSRAVEDPDNVVRSTALEILTSIWSDKSTRPLLFASAVEDRDDYVRRTALLLLADNWPDESTQALLRSRAVEDQDNGVRRVVLRLLADNWRDKFTQALLHTRAVEDQDNGARRVALRLLANNWRDETTQALLHDRALEDHDGYARATALRLLAAGWPDESTLALLLTLAVEGQDAEVCDMALETLAANWPDEYTRALLLTSSVEDQDKEARSAALASLADNSPDESVYG